MKRLKRLFSYQSRPSFLIVGVQKSGTSSLFRYLNQHPRLIGSKRKEVHFFDCDYNYRKGTDWYHRFFVKTGFPLTEKHCFEATPVYLYRTHCAERIHAYDSSIKLICILRDPVKRAYSAWNMYRELRARDEIPEGIRRDYVEGIDNRIYETLFKPDTLPSFEDCIDRELQEIRMGAVYQEPAFIRRGIYIEQIRKYLEYFDRDNLLILGFNELARDSKMTLNKVLRFIGLGESRWDFLKTDVHNSRQYPARMSSEVEQALAEHFDPYNNELFELVGERLDW